MNPILYLIIFVLIVLLDDNYGHVDFQDRVIDEFEIIQPMQCIRLHSDMYPNIVLNREL